jgi:hypothetical protein
MKKAGMPARALGIWPKLLSLATPLLYIIGIASLVLGLIKRSIDVLALAATIKNLSQSGSTEQKIIAWPISGPWWAYLVVTLAVVVGLVVISVASTTRAPGAESPPTQPQQGDLERALAAALVAKKTAEAQRDDALQKLNKPAEPPGGYYPYSEQAPLADTGETAIHVTDDTREQTFALRHGGFRTIHWSGLQLRIDHLGLMQRQSGNYGYAARIKAVLQTERGYQLRIAAAADVFREQDASVFIIALDENMISWTTGDRSICHFSIQEEGDDKRSVAFTMRVTRINSSTSELRVEGYFDDWSA